MFKQKINYTDFNGVERNEEFHFHLSLPEVTRLEAKVGMSIGDHTKQLTEEGDLNKLLEFLEDIILNSYGKKTTDGKSFIKSKELRSEFEHSQAYAELFEMLITNPDLASKFGQGVADNGKAKKNEVEPTVVNEN